MNAPLRSIVTVPREPTLAMRRAADERKGTGDPYRDIYVAMVEAAQSGSGPKYIGDLELAILRCRTLEDFLTVQKTVQMIAELEKPGAIPSA